MTDHFLLFDVPRRPWLDPDSLKDKFVHFSAEVHPDRVHQSPPAEKAQAQERYTALNTAFQCLREPKDRLRHLLELEWGRPVKDLRHPPNDLVNLSFAVGKVCREADKLILEHAAATSPLVKVQLFEHAHAELEKIQKIRDTISHQHLAVLETLKQIDAEWLATPENHPALLSALEIVSAQIGFFNRWLQQLQERQFRLTF